MLYIGIDLGTSAVKILLMDRNGNVLKTVSKSYPIYFSNNNWAEQNPDDWFDKTFAGLKELLYGVEKEKVQGISFSGQMHGLVIIDKDYKVVRPAILWNDGRTGEETDYLNNRIGKKRLSNYTGNIAFAGFTAPKLLWLKKHEPISFGRIYKIMLPKDYLVYKLSGQISTDSSDASGTLLFDVEKNCWSSEMIDICDIKREMLPDIYKSFEVVGTIKKDLASELGLNPSVKIVAGAADNAASAVGTGTIGTGKCNISLGTSGTVLVSSHSFNSDNNYSLHSFANADGKYYLMGCMLSAASCNQWWMNDILKSEDYEGEQNKITNLSDNEVFFLPYLTGERSPHNDPYAKGAFLGMSRSTKREDMYQAVLEGVSFGLRDSLEIVRNLGITVNESNISGGGAKSMLWKRILSGVLNVRLDILSVDEGPAFGAAILAAVACGEFSDLKEATGKLVKISNSVYPDMELVNRYDEKYRIFKRLYPMLLPFFHSRAQSDLK